MQVSFNLIKQIQITTKKMIRKVQSVRKISLVKMDSVEADVQENKICDDQAYQEMKKLIKQQKEQFKDKESNTT